MTHKVIVFEFNELVPNLMDSFIAQGFLPNFSKLKDESDVFISDTIDHGVKELEPWVQYCSTHTGVRAGVHQVMELGQGHTYSGPRYWDVASNSGRKVMIWSSMNAHTQSGFKGVLLPDPWAGEKGNPAPESILPFYRFVSKNVQEHTKSKTPLTKSDILSFLKFSLTHGVGWKTFCSLVSQIFHERKTGKYRWRRAFVLDQIVADTFCHFYQKERPDLATLFLNSTAYVQHRFWRNMDPASFLVKPKPEDQEELKNAILEGYQNMDRILGQVRKVAKDARILLVSAHGQQPHLKHESTGGKISFRPTSFDKLAATIGLSGIVRIEPAMTEVFVYFFESEQARQKAMEVLQSVELEGTPATQLTIGPDFSLSCKCRIHHPVSADANLNWVVEGESKSAGFFELFYLIQAVKSGRHHPDGILWVSRPNGPGKIHDGRVPVASVAATVIKLLGLNPPGEMQTPALPIT